MQIITGLLVFVLLHFQGEERSLNTLQEIASSPSLIAVAAEKLCQMQGIPAVGNQLKSPLMLTARLSQRRGRVLPRRSRGRWRSSILGW